MDSSVDFLNKPPGDNNLPSVFAFPKDGNSWRIDWFGDIAFPNRLLRRKQPSVLIHLSRVLDTSFRENPAVLRSPDSTFVSKQRKVWISVGTFQGFPVALMITRHIQNRDAAKSFHRPVYSLGIDGNIVGNDGYVWLADLGRYTWSAFPPNLPMKI